MGNFLPHFALRPITFSSKSISPIFIVTDSGSWDFFDSFDFFRKALELLSAFHSTKDLVFPNLLASFTAVLVQDADVTPLLVEVFLTTGRRVNEATEIELPVVPWL